MTTTLTFDSTVYTLLAVEKAAYRFSDRFAFQLECCDAGVKVELEPRRADISDASLSAALNDFKNEVLDQNLREKIKLETAPIRNLILAHAFSRTGLTGQ